MTKRTKRYGGFLIGDKVRVKKPIQNIWGETLTEGYVIKKGKGELLGEFLDSLMHVKVLWYVPNQLINLTRIEEKKKEIPELPPISEETAKELDERFDAICGKIRKRPMVISLNPTREHWTKRFIDEWLDPLPSPYTRDVYSSSLDFML